MSYKKIILILFVPFLLQVIIACCECENTLRTLNFTNKSILLDNLDHSGSEIKFSATNTVVKEAYGIYVRVLREEVSFYDPIKSLSLQGAYACSCVEDIRYLPKENVTSVQVLTLRDFDTNHPTNSDVTSLFKVFEQGNAHYEIKYTPIVDYFDLLNKTHYNYGVEGISFDIFLLTPPSVASSQQFMVRMTLSDGRIIEGVTPLVELI
ncbi:DUF5034 domain-containing protein [Sphingobacterium hungaricum]